MSDEPYEVTENILKSYTQIKKKLLCAMCGHKFKVGDIIHFVYANGTKETPALGTGNFHVCKKCDGPDILKRAKEDFDVIVAGAKRWDIYGPDWQRSQ